MIEVEINEYKKAFVELNEIIKRMSKKEKERIPQSFMKNLEKEMDKEYTYVYDENKGIQEQELKVETKALLVEIYEKYLAPEEEKELWEKYDKICLESIEEKKKRNYNPENIFKENIKSDVNKNLPVTIEKKSIFARFLEIVKNFFK